MSATRVDDPTPKPPNVVFNTVDVDRTYRYVAIEHVGKYASKLALRIELGPGAPPADLHADQVRTETGRYHDVEFAPAKVHPERPTLRTADEFFGLQSKLAAVRLVEGLAAHWRASFCERDSFSFEEAARCAIAGVETPDGVAKALQTEYRGDTGELARALGPGPSAH